MLRTTHHAAARPFVATLLLQPACTGAEASSPEIEVSDRARPLVQDVCLAYDDLRYRDGVVLDAEVQAIHARAAAVGDMVDDGRAAWEARQKN